MDVIEGKSGEEYSPKEKNNLIYQYLNDIIILKEKESSARKEITKKINYIEKEFSMSKNEYKAWISLKLEEINKDDYSKIAAVELNNELLAVRNTYGKSEFEERLERDTSYDEDEESQEDKDYRLA